MLFRLTVAYIGGILLSAAVEPPSAAVAGGTTILLLLAWTLRRTTFSGRGALLAAFVLLGLLWAELSLRPPADGGAIARFADERTQVLQGRVRQLTVFADGRSRFDLEVDRVFRGRSIARAHGRVRVSVREGDITAREGQKVRLRARLRRPRNFDCPGEFDYVTHLAAQGIHAIASVREAAQVIPIVAGKRNTPDLLSTLRHTVAQHIDANVAPTESALVRALLIGQRHDVTPQQRRLLGEGGVSHLFSISGLHFGLLGLMLYLLLRRLYCRSSRLMLWHPPRRVLPLLMIAPMGLYLLLTGNALPTRRAFCMASLAGLLYSSNRRTPPLHLLAATALLMLLAQPLSLFRPSFQLSFAGLLGILHWMPRWQPALDKAPSWLRWPGVLALTTLAATLATAPLVLWHFHLFAPAGLPANLVATPLIAWGALPVGLLGVLLLPLAPQWADLCLSGSGALVALTIFLVEHLTALPGLGAWHYFPGWRDMLALGGLGSALLLRATCRHRRLLQTGLVAATLGLLCWQPGDGPVLRTAALSVGQGDATLLSLNGSDHYLVDGGGLPGSSFDIGERLVAPALGRLNVRRLKGVILTHDHPDHRDGLRFILNTLPVERFYAGVPFDDLDPELKSIVQQRKIPYTMLADGWSHIGSPPGTTLRLFSPDQSHADVNERSLIVYAGLGRDGVLLTGDMGPSGLRQLLATGWSDPVSLLKLPHHGSRRPHPDTYLSTFAPRYGFVSAGRNNPYHLPSAATLAAFESAGIALFRTDRHGTLSFVTNGEGWQPERLSGRLFN